MDHLLEWEDFLNENKINSQIFYHNTTISNKNNILKNGFNLSINNRGKLYGNGIYFSETPNTRYGDEIIEVKINPKNILIDLNDELKWEDTDLGFKVIKYARENIKDWKLKDHRDSNPKGWVEALNGFISKNKYDALLTYEYNNKILIVFDPKIITII